MLMRAGQRYRCQNPACRSEIEVLKPSIEAMKNLQCCCGSEMKRAYTKPAIRSLTMDIASAFFTGQEMRREQS